MSSIKYLVLSIKNNYKVVFILLLAFVLRFYRLGDYPALNADEASIGYDAYSLIQTGMDQHGNFWPISFQSFNDYKPGIIVYLVLPFIKIFGLTIFWVRFLPALLGVGTVLALYLLVVEISNNSKLNTQNSILATTAAFMLAVSPWHIHFSRGAWEVNVATFFMVGGVWLFLKWMNRIQSVKYLVLSIVSFVLSMYSYHSSRLIIPLLGVGLFCIYKNEILRNYKLVFRNLTVGVILLTPLLISLINGGLSRASGVSITADSGIAERTKEQQSEHYIIGLGGRYIPRIIHNKYVNYTLVFAKNWTEHFGGNFLFTEGDGIQRNKIPEMGLLYYFEILSIFVGIVVLLKSEGYSLRSKYLIFWWLLIAPTAAALTFQSPHALRAQNMIIPLTIISAFGLISIIQVISLVRSKILLSTFYYLLSTFIIWNIAFYLHQYYVHMSKELPYSSQYGLKELSDFLLTIPNDKKVIISDRYDQPYILTLFYLKYPPKDFQNHHSLTTPDRFGFSTVRSFDRYNFWTIDWEKDKLSYPGAYIIGTDQEIPDEANVIKNIYGSNGYKYFQIVAN